MTVALQHRRRLSRRVLCIAPPLLLQLLLACQHRPGHCSQLQDHRKLHPAYWIKAAGRLLAGSDTAFSPACSADYGALYIERWHRLQGSYCGAPLNASAAAYSSVACHAHPEAQLVTCLCRNVLLDASAFMRRAGDRPLPAPPPGSVRLSCARAAEPAAFLRGRVASNEGSAAWLVDAAAFEAPAAAQQAACGGASAVQHPVLVVTRTDGDNAFHTLEGVVGVFAGLATLQLPPQLLQDGLEVVIADRHPAGPFIDIWRRLAHPHPLRLLATQPWPDGTCLATLLLAPYTPHASSVLTYKGGSASEVVCESTLLVATSLWLRHLFRDVLPPSGTPPGSQADDNGGAAGPDVTEPGAGIDDSSSGVGSSSSSEGGGGRLSIARHRRHGPAHAAALAPLSPTPPASRHRLQHAYIVWLSRARFERAHESVLTSWQRTRALGGAQEEALVAELQRAVLQWNAAACVSGQSRGCAERRLLFTLQVAELSELSFYPDQLALLMRTRVLVGVHGAGLANAALMAPRRGAVVEVWHGMDGNYHYHNLAHMLGHSYAAVACDSDSLDVARVVAAAAAGMDAADAAAGDADAAGRRSWWRRGWGGG